MTSRMKHNQIMFFESTISRNGNSKLIFASKIVTHCMEKVWKYNDWKIFPEKQSPVKCYVDIV